MAIRPAQLLVWGLAFLLALGIQSALAGKNDGRLDIYWIDVEGGAATLVVTPAGESVLIDSGNPGPRDANRIFQVATKTAGLERIDHLVTTHFHVDHFGGAAALSKVLPIGHVHDNGEWPEGRERPSPEYLAFPAAKRSVMSPGDTIPLAAAPPAGPSPSKNAPATAADAPPLTLKCLAARRTFLPPTPEQKQAPIPECCGRAQRKPNDLSDNANSVVLLLSLGDFQFFDAGDLTWNMEEKLVCPVNLVGEVDVYQATHHGLDQSNNNLVIESLQPRVAIINNGTTKGCEPVMFAALKNAKSIQAIYQLHKNLRPDGATVNAPDDFIANLDKECHGNHVHLSVDPTGKTYTVAIPATGHQKSYDSK